MRLILLVSIVGVFSSFRAEASIDVTGDTLSSARAAFSGLNRNIDRVLEPDSVIGKVGLLSSSRIPRAVCAELGSAVGYAFSINAAIRFHTPATVETMSASARDVAEGLSHLIHILTDTRNKYCFSDTAKYADVRTAMSKAKATAADVDSILATLQKR